jgi:hypothetical protein
LDRFAKGIVGIPVATVKSRMFFARKYLARMLLSAGLEAQRSEPRPVGGGYSRARISAFT